MKSRTFEVPVDLMVEFAEIMDSNEMDNTIEGVSEVGEIQIRVEYESDQKKIIHEIHDIIDNYNEEHENDESGGKD